MADNMQVSQGTGTTVATKQDTSNVHHQKTLMEYMGTSDPAPISKTDPMPSGDRAINDGGSAPYHSRTLGSAGANISAGQARLYGFDAYNANATVDAYIKFYNMAAGSIVTGTDIPFLGPFLIPAGGGMNIKFAKGVQFSTRLAVRIVTGLADTNTVSPTSNEILFNAEYKE